MPFLKSTLLRKTVILSLALFVVLVSLSAIDKKFHFFSKVNQKIGEVAGTLWISSKFLDDLLPTSVTDAISSPYQDVQGDVIISGQVGIGTLNPGYKLEVSGGYIGATNSESGTGTLRLGAVDGRPGIWSSSTTLPMELAAANGQPILLNPGGSGTGNVGIGTVNPLSKLHVISSLNGSVSNYSGYYWNSAVAMENTITGNNVADWAGAATLSLYGKDAMAQNTDWTDVEVLNIKGETTAANQEAYNITSRTKLVPGSFGYNFWADDGAGINSTGGTNYGLYISLDNAATNRWGIYQQSNNPNYFAGSIRAGAANFTGCDIYISDDICLRDNQNSAMNVYNYAGTAWAPVNAIAFNTQSSRDIKKDITPLSSSDFNSMLQTLNSLSLYNFRFKEETETTQLHTGVIAEESPISILSNDLKGINLYDYTSLAIGAIKAQQQQINPLLDIVDIVNKIGHFFLIETQRLIVNGVDILERLNTLSQKVDTQQKEIESLKQEIEQLKAKVQ